jgi:hypothetical protein
MSRKFLFIVLYIAGALSLFAQSYNKGAIHDPEAYSQVPQKAATREVKPLPSSASLKAYAPYPGDQNPYGTCTAWANAYAARTIAESIGLKRLDRTLSTSNAFSPVFVYRNLSNDPDCVTGTQSDLALELMKTQGVPKRLSIEYTTDFKLIPLSLFSSSRKYPIKDYGTVFCIKMELDSVRGIWKEKEEEGPEKVRKVKRTLAEGKPAIIVMNCPDSFEEAKGRWIPKENPRGNYGFHAMCVVGYDDSMYGGAFEVQNSWGTDWGNEGYIWISYNDFGNFVVEAYELIEDLMAYQNIAEFSGSVEIEMKGSSKGMEVEWVNQGYYKTKRSHPTGTDFRYLMNCNKPAYLYSFTATDNADSYFRIFPADGVLAVLDYRENTFAFPPDRPGEIDWMFLDGPTGTEYLVVLFSKQPLDIDAIGNRFMKAKGNFAQRVEQAVGSNYIHPRTAKYEKGRMAYTAQSSNANAVFGLLLAIEHK